MAEFSPMMKQYFEVKERNKDALLFYRVGDFAIYGSQLWKGTPHIGALSSCPQSLPVRVKSSSFDAVMASSKNIS